MARLAALVLRPRLNLTRFHGIFAPNFKHRHKNVPQRVRGRVNDAKPLAPMNWPLPHFPVLRGTWTPVQWAQRLKRVLAIDIEKCPDCGGKLRIIACIEDPQLIVKILAYVCSHEAVTVQAVARGPPGAAIVA